MERKHWLGAAVALALVGVGVVAAQETGKIEGSVQDAGTGKGIGGATCTAGAARATTGGDGKFTLTVAAGQHTVKCEARGYRAGTAAVAVAAGGTAKVSIRLSAVPPTADPAPVADAAEQKAAEPVRDSARRRPPAPPAKKIKTRAYHFEGAGAAPAPRPVAVAAPPPDFNREQYEARKDTGYKSPRVEPLSTFSIDVDTASYANVRRFIDQSRLPPPDAVKIEELINYFSYDYPEPKGDDPFSVHTEVSTAPWNPEHQLVKIGLQGKKIPMEALPPSNLVFLLDVSGSMNSPDKLPLLKAAFKLLVNNMRPVDRVAIVVYAGAAGLVLPSTPGKEREKILFALDQLSAGGSTAGGAGIQLAYKVAQDNFIQGGNNRVILATDGDFNVGVSGDGELVRMIEEKRKSGVFLTVLGFGTGNYQDAKMEKLAAHGNGNHAYIDSILEAKKVLVSEMGGTLFTIAKDVKIQVEMNPAHVKGYRLIGYENRMLAAEDFNDDKKDAGELGAGHTVTALYEIIPAGSKEEVPGVDALKYQQAAPTGEAANEMMTVKLRYKQPDGDTSKLLSQTVPAQVTALEKTSDDFRFAAAVAAFGMVLRDSEHKGTATLEDARTWAKAALGKDTEGYRFDFVKLVEKAALLKATGQR